MAAAAAAAMPSLADSSSSLAADAPAGAALPSALIDTPFRVAKYHRAFAARFWDGLEVDWATANGQSVAVLRRDGAVVAVLTITVRAGEIDQVLWMLNPAKIAPVAAARSDP